MSTSPGSPPAAAGLDGIERALNPGDAVQGDVGHFSSQEIAELGLRFLPRSAGEALDALDRDGVVFDSLGPVIGPTLLRVKRSEIAAYDLTVGDWERSAYLETV